MTIDKDEDTELSCRPRIGVHLLLVSLLRVSYLGAAAVEVVFCLSHSCNHSSHSPLLSYPVWHDSSCVARTPASRPGYWRTSSLTASTSGCQESRAARSRQASSLLPVSCGRCHPDFFGPAPAHCPHAPFSDLVHPCFLGFELRIEHRTHRHIGDELFSCVEYFGQNYSYS